MVCVSTVLQLRVHEAKERVVQDFKQGNYHGVRKPFKQISFGMLARVSMGRPGRWAPCTQAEPERERES